MFALNLSCTALQNSNSHTLGWIKPFKFRSYKDNEIDGQIQVYEIIASTSFFLSLAPN